MAIRRSTPVFFKASGATDSLDGTNSPPGSMAALTNLVPDNTTDGFFVPRPASALIYDFADFSDPGFISCMFTIGDLAYGLIASSLNAGRDEPFCVDLSTGTMVAVGGTIDATTTPTSPASSGVWTPPTMAVVGTLLLVTHPGFPGGAGAYFGWFDISNPAAPVWHAGNTTTNALPAVPTAVAQFGNRAWFAVNNTAWFSDILAPTTITNAAQVLTFGDSQAVTAFGGVPLAATQIGGIVQSLMVFKGVSQMWQILGDYTLNTLSINEINYRTGTNAPLTIAGTPLGLAFVSDHGLRIVDINAQVSPVIGDHGTGIAVPFINALVPSRMAATYNSGIIRISAQNGALADNPFQEWWYDTTRRIWTGPHTFPASLIQPWGTQFVLAPVGIEAAIYSSDTINVVTSSFIENDAQMSYVWKTSQLPDTKQMAENAMVETTLQIALVDGLPVTVSAIDEQGTSLGSAVVSASGSPSYWGIMVWGTDVWGAAFSLISPRQIFWPAPVEFKKMQMQAVGDSGSNLRFGNLYMRYQILKYLQQ